MTIVFSLLLTLFPQVKAENGRFNIYQEGRRIGVEEFSIGPHAGGYVAQGQTQITAGNQRFTFRSRMELDAQLRPTFYEFESDGSVIRLKVDQPLSELEYVTGDARESFDVRFPSDAAILDDNFFHHYLILLYRNSLPGSKILSFVPQQVTMGELEVRASGDNTFELETSNLKLIATTDDEGRLLRLTVPEANVVVER